MPRNNSQIDSAVYSFVQRVLHHRHRFNAPQKSVILLVLLCSVAAACLHWLHVVGFLLVYAAAVYFTNIKCNTALTRGELYRSELLLSFVSNVKDAVGSVLNLFVREPSTQIEDDSGATNSGPPPNLPQNAAGSCESPQCNDSQGEAKENNSLQKEANTVNDEIERFLNLVMRDFVQSWYKTISLDPDVLEEIHEILYQATLHICKARLAKLNVKKVTCDVIKLFQQHLGAVLLSKAFVRSQPKRRRSSTTRVSSLEEAFELKYGYHVALENETSEINYVRSLVDIVLVRLLPIQIHRCRIARALVTEILTCNVVLPLIKMMSSPEWIHKAVKEIFGNNSGTGHKSVDFTDSDTLQEKVITKEVETFHDTTHSSDIQTFSLICNTSHENDGNEIRRQNTSDLSAENSGAESGEMKNGKGRSRSGDKEVYPNPESDVEKHFKVTPHEEITVTNVTAKDSPRIFRRHSVIGAADLAEEAGEMTEERQPPNGEAAACVFEEGSNDVGTAAESRSVSRPHPKIPRPHSQIFSSPERPNSPKNTENIDYVLEFRDANSEYGHHLNGFSESGDTSPTDDFKDCSLPVTLLGPSIRTKLSPDACECSVASDLRNNGHLSQGLNDNGGCDIMRNPCYISFNSESQDSETLGLNLQSASVKQGSHKRNLSNESTDSKLCTSSRETTNEHRENFYLDIDVEDAEDADIESEIQLYKPQENWANLARNIPNSTDIESALANCMPVCKPDEYRVLDSKSRLFHSVAIPTTDTIANKGSSSYTIYKIEFEAWYWADGEVVLRKGTVLRRFREFVNLQARLEDNPTYKPCLKDIKGPKRWMSLPFGNMDKVAIEGRRKYLEKFLKLVIEKQPVCNGEEIKEFLAYEGRSHIAFVRKAPELSVPRIDKMFVRTMSGVFGRIATVLPNLTPDVLPSLSRKDSNPEAKVMEVAVTWDEDNIELNFGIIQQEHPHVAAYDKFMDEYFTRIQQDEMPTHSLPSDSGEPNLGSDHRLGEIDLENDSMDYVPHRSDGDGSATPDPPTSQGLDERCYSEIPLARAILDLGARALRGQTNWVCRESVMEVIQIVAGRALDRWLEDQVTMLSSSEQCCLYLELLRETIWPKGKLASDDEEVLSEMERAELNAQAKKALKEFFPEFLVALIGDQDLEDGITQAIDSVENQKINRHFLYTFLDLILERLFPELAIQVDVPVKT
ncbi:uncharacterized protein LOC135463654 [Liolophura sinensis]|uniref:uncharacterized protein LOC135463654 n=1 Tax=Liolophura sinensis TaxID=3198878 RepID=UPI003159663D